MHVDQLRAEGMMKRADAADVIDIPGTSSFPRHPGSTSQQFLTVVQPLLKEPVHTVWIIELLH